MDELGRRIKSIRNEHGVTQKEFGSRLGISHAHVSNIESGKDTPSDNLIKLMSREFGVNEEWLRTGNGERKAADYYGEDIEVLKAVFSDLLIILGELTSTKSNVKKANYSYCLNACANLLLNDGLPEDRYLDYLGILESFFADFQRFTGFMSTLRKINPKDGADEVDINSKVESYIKYLVEDFRQMVDVWR